MARTKQVNIVFIRFNHTPFYKKDKLTVKLKVTGSIVRCPLYKKIDMLDFISQMKKVASSC